MGFTNASEPIYAQNELMSMDKIRSLQEKSAVFRSLLEMHEGKDTDAALLLKWLTPLFDEIAKGKVIPPQHFEYRLALGKDSPFYEPESLYSTSYSDFIAALEDWSSQPWYQDALKRTRT
ncbi:hypothetical protein [Paraburkholderia phenoliruptrix]|uniref:hypothetical protein n=1 Tax=Paraburkholderia phenoliruptrix TaxID=252970 RepID=UPI002869855B|nr:hypothetical protein [Paraburkholderia phenoliruptrix]WMY07439.1 hypothetical protein P3F88_14325 [Paraburkholderia phenoliruptrix]